MPFRTRSRTPASEQVRQFRRPTIDSVSAAAASVKIPEDYRVSLTDADGKDAIHRPSLPLVYKKQDDSAR
jgi:hypothetical protein